MWGRKQTPLGRMSLPPPSDDLVHCNALHCTSYKSIYYRHLFFPTTLFSLLLPPKIDFIFFPLPEISLCLCHQNLIRAVDTHSFTSHMPYPVTRKPWHTHKPTNPSKRHGRYLEKRNWLFLCHACIDISRNDTAKHVQNNKYAQKKFKKMARSPPPSLPSFYLLQ